MTLNVTDILASLPEDQEKDATAEQLLIALTARLAGRPVPTGALRRLWSLGTLQAKIAVAYLVYWIRSSYRTVDERERMLNETHLKAALDLLGGMSYLRGIVMKIGQTLANYPGLVPSEFFDVLGRLHFEAPPMHFSLLREQVRAELGAEVEELFASFDTQAFAAASLGQVHRARLHSGELVAVKVQYPGIADTIVRDVRALLALLTPMRLSADWDSLRAQIDDVRRVLELETDYLREARCQMRARDVFEPDDLIVVPRVIVELTTRRVLTMEYVDGVHIDRYLAGDPSQEARNRYGEMIMRASFRIAHAARIWYADSHPGNYVFMSDGRLGVLDFGCCREFSSAEWDYYNEIWDVYMNRDCAGLDAAMLRAVGADPAHPLKDEHLKFLTDYSHWSSDYIRMDAPYDFGDDTMAQQGVDYLNEIATKRYFRSIPVNVWITRQLLGLRALLYRLRAKVNMHRLAREEEWNILGDRPAM